MVSKNKKKQDYLFILKSLNELIDKDERQLTSHLYKLKNEYNKLVSQKENK